MKTEETVVHVIRHGRTALNAQGRFRGLQDVPLDAQGLAEAEAVASRLAACPIVAITHSPLSRARQTAEPLGRLLGIELTPDPGLRDVDYGAWTARTAAQAADIDADAFRRYREDPRSATPPSGEPLAMVERRVLHAVGLLASRWQGREVAFVSHEIPIRLLVSRPMGIEGAAIWEIPLPTGSVTTLAGSPRAWRVVSGPTAP